MDTNVLLFLQNHYFPSTFISVWESINEFISENKLISIKEVQREITSEKHKTFWNNIDISHENEFYQDLIHGEIECLQEIKDLEIYSKIIFKRASSGDEYEWSLKKEWEEGRAVADPFLICHGLFHNSTIITTESPDKQLNIPHVCSKLNVKCIGLEKFFLENQLKF